MGDNFVVLANDYLHLVEQLPDILIFHLGLDDELVEGLHKGNYRGNVLVSCQVKADEGVCEKESHLPLPLFVSLS